MKNTFRKAMAMLLAVLFAAAAFPVGAVHGVTPLDSMNVVTLTIPTESEENPNGWGRPDLEFMGGWTHNGSWRKVVYCRDSRSGQVVYCIEPGRPTDSDVQYGDHDESYWENHPGNETIDADTVKAHIGRIFKFGYLGNGNPEWNSGNSAHASQMAHTIATQLLVWEVIVGERDASFDHIDASQYGKNNVLEEVMDENPIRQQILSAYNSIVSSVQEHLTLPSFCSEIVSQAASFPMEWNGSVWAVELTDTNGVLSDYEFTSNVSGMTFTKNGNKLTITSPEMPEGDVLITANRPNSNRYGVVTWTGRNNQTTVSYGATVSDPIGGFFKLIRSGAGSLHLVKTAEDGNVAGIGFTIEGQEQRIHRVTDANGVIDIDTLLPGTYTVTEDESELYAPQAPQTVAIVSGETATVRFHNTLRKGGLHLVKTAEDGNVSGIGFTIFGNGVNVHRVTDANGVIDIADLQPGTYTVTEDESEFYAPQAPQTVTVSYGETATVNFHNTLRKGELHLVKTSEDGNVSGIGFTIEGNGVSIHRFTDEKGVIDIDGLLPGVYTVTEDASELYAPQDSQTVTVVADKTSTVTFNNTLRRGALKVTKTAEDGLVEGLTFHLYGTSDCGLPVDEYAVTDANGIAVFENILIGSGYVLEEVDTPDQYVVPDSQTAVIEWNEVSGHNFENKLKRGSIKGYKLDRETGKHICGALFGLFAEDEADLIEANALMLAKSDDNGVFLFENIICGSYLVCELRPAEGYLENDTVYPVTVDDNGAVIEITVVNDMIPEISTNAKIDGEKDACATDVLVLVDTVEYKHLVPGKEYLVRGVLMDKSTGEAFIENGEKIVSEVSFIPKEPCGSIDILFTFDARLIKAETRIVVFECLYSDGILLASHEDINDADQTVTVLIPRILTEASIDGQKEAFNTGIIKVEDKVSYFNLTPGREYTLRGRLMDKSTGRPFNVNGRPVTAHTTFTPDARNGEVILTFIVPSECFTATTDLVVFERLYRENTEIASHEDINDESQTVRVYVPSITTTATIDGQKDAFNTGIITVEDKVIYTNLIPGREYTVHGVLMDKATGEPFMVNGEPAIAEVAFVAEASDGEVVLTFTFDARLLTEETQLVAFERLFCGETEIASHEDIEDEDQTVTVKPKPDIPKTGDTDEPDNIGVWIGLCAIALGGAVACVLLYFKNKKNGGEK